MTLLRVPWTSRRSNQFILKKSVLNIHWKDWCWSWNSNTLATWCEELNLLKRPWCWERLKVGGEGDDREWDGWMALSTQWTWLWEDSGISWWTGMPGVLFSWGHKESDMTKQLNWTNPKHKGELIKLNNNKTCSKNGGRIKDYDFPKNFWLGCISRNASDTRITGKFGLRIQNEAGQRLTEFC